MDNRLWLLVLFWLHTASCQPSTGPPPLTCSTEGQVSIVQTTNIDAPNAGRVQVCQGGLWGTIAESAEFPSPWREKNAQVACIEAGFSGALNSILPLTISAADRAPFQMPVFYTDMRCSGTESSITDCSAVPNPDSFTTSSGFNHLNDVFVVCRPSTTAYSDVHTAGVVHGDLRLFGDPDNGKGAVEIYFDGLGWLSICPQGFDDSDAVVICQQFGYETGQVVTYMRPDLGLSHPLYLFDTECVLTGNPPVDTNRLEVGRCSFRVSSISNSCPSSAFTYAGVACSSSSGATEGDVRFFGGTNNLAGIVEVFYGGKWGMVCERGQFSLTDARTVCEQLRLDENDAAIMSADSLLDEASRMKPIWLAGVDCSTSDSVFTSCSRLEPAIGYGECRTFELAASRCGFSSSGLPSGAVTGIVIGVIFLVFFVIPIGYYLVKGYWPKRNENSCYRTMTTPSGWCDCCQSPTPRRNFNLHTTPRTQPTAEITLTTISTEPVEPPVQFGGFSGGSSAAAAPEPPPTAKEQEDSSFSKQAPPTYNTSENYPTFTAPPQDLPPPYPGPAPLGFADAAYPPPVLPTAPSAPPLQSGYPGDPAQLPYPVNQEVGGGAYPPPTFPSEPAN